MKTLREKDLDHLVRLMVPVDKYAKRGPEIIVESHGCIVKRHDGKELLDFNGGGAVSVNVGYGRKELAEAAMAQMVKHHWVTQYGWYSNATTIEYAHKLAEVTPEGLKRFCFTPGGGSDAVDTAIKMARLYWRNKGKDKYKVVSRLRSYHGTTYGAVSATGIEAFWKDLGPLLPGFVHIPPPYCYRCPWGKEYPGCEIECAQALDEGVKKEGKDTVAAFIAEPVIGVGGCIPPPPEYWPMIEQICNEHNILLIIDEVMTGFGRTGKFFAVEHWNIKPDIMTMSKGITSSYLPLGGVAITEDIYEGITPAGKAFYHVFTTTGHPVSCAVAMKNLEIIIRENLVANAERVGKYTMNRLQEFKELPCVGNVHGLGLMMGIDLTKNKATKAKIEPDTGVQLVLDALDRGLMIRQFDGIVFVAPPLIISPEEIDRGLDILKPLLTKLKI
jgi:adenosylmethionine-8-amino-7-oxononanoate aminotransferase